MSVTAHAPISETLDRVRALGVMPVIEINSVDDAKPVLAALSRGGLPAAEVTLRTPAGIDSLRLLRQEQPDALVGAGTVRTLADAERAIEAGAQFVVSPSTYPDLIEFCLAAGVLALPGACTPTEIDLALRAGASLVKFFPAEAMGGVPFLNALAGPFPDVQLMPTGGVNASNLTDYIRLPLVAACGGSWMVAPELLREHAFDRVQALASEAVAIVAEARRV